MARNAGVLGLDELHKAFADVLEAVAGNELAQALAEAGDEILVPDIKQRAPRDRGDLVESIEALVEESGPEKGAAKVRATKFYGLFHEFGTSKMPAHPFMRPAFDEHKNDVVELARGKLEHGIKKKVG